MLGAGLESSQKTRCDSKHWAARHKFIYNPVLLFAWKIAFLEKDRITHVMRDIGYKNISKNAGGFSRRLQRSLLCNKWDIKFQLEVPANRQFNK